MSTSSEYYQSLRDSQQLLLTRNEARWVHQLTAPQPQVDVVVNFGCGMQLTPHLMVEAIDVLQALGVKIAAVAGPQWCCGMPRAFEDAEAGDRIIRSSLRRMAQFQPRDTVHSCGAWWPRVGRLDGPEDTVPYGLRHMTEFIAAAVEESADRIAWRSGAGARVLIHLKAQDLSPEVRAERAVAMAAIESSVPAVLEMIPGVEVVAEVEKPAQGAPCEMAGEESVLAGLPAEDRSSVQRALEDQADRAGATVLVCAHHQCYREWGKFGSERLPVRHYLSMLAEALGVARSSRYHACWALASLDEIVTETGPAWRSWGLDRAEALALAGRIFPSHPARA